MNRALLVLLISLVCACASVPRLTPAATKVRRITAEEAKGCKFLQVVQYTDTLAGMGKSPGLVHQAYAFVSTQADADWFWGHVNYSGEAYRCPAP